MPHIETSHIPEEVMGGTEILQAQLARTQNIQITQPRSGQDTLNQDLTFFDLCRGKKFEFAHGLFLTLLVIPELMTTTLSIYGPVGMGKTHLLHAAGNHIREQYQQL